MDHLLGNVGVAAGGAPPVVSRHSDGLHTDLYKIMAARWIRDLSSRWRYEHRRGLAEEPPPPGELDEDIAFEKRNLWGLMNDSTFHEFLEKNTLPGALFDAALSAFTSHKCRDPRLCSRQLSLDGGGIQQRRNLFWRVRARQSFETISQHFIYQSLHNIFSLR